MTLLQFFSAWKNRSSTHKDVFDHAYIEGFSNGFEYGLKMASEVDKISIKHIRDNAIDATLGRLNGSNKTHN